MDQVFSVSEACAIAHIGRTSFYQALHSGALTARKRGARTFVLGSELQRFIEALPQIELKHPIERRAAPFRAPQKAARPTGRTLTVKARQNAGARA